MKSTTRLPTSYWPQEKCKISFSWTCRTFHWQHIWQTNDLNQTSSLSFVLKPHAQILHVGSHFWMTKNKISILCGQLLCINRFKKKKLNNLCFTQTLHFFLHSSNFANFSFDVQWQLLDWICFLNHSRLLMRLKFGPWCAPGVRRTSGATGAYLYRAFSFTRLKELI